MRSIFDIILFSDKVNYDGSFGLSAEIFYRLWLGQNCGSRSEKFRKKMTKFENLKKLIFSIFFANFLANCCKNRANLNKKLISVTRRAG